MTQAVLRRQGSFQRRRRSYVRFGGVGSDGGKDDCLLVLSTHTGSRVLQSSIHAQCGGTQHSRRSHDTGTVITVDGSTVSKARKARDQLIVRKQLSVRRCDWSMMITTAMTVRVVGDERKQRIRRRRSVSGLI